LFLLASLSCRTPLDEGVPLPHNDPRPKLLLEGLQEQIRLRTALQGSARLSIEASDLSFSRPQRMAVERPGRLRVEVLGLFDQVAALVVTRDRSYQFFDVRTGQIEQGPVDPDILWRVARIDLSPEEAVGLLLGAPSAQAGLSVAEAVAFRDGRIAFTRLDAQNVHRERYVFDALGRLVETDRMTVLGGLIWKARYSDFQSVSRSGGETISFAFDIELDFPRVEAHAELAFKQVSLPEKLPDSLFVLQQVGMSESGLAAGADLFAGTGP